MEYINWTDALNNKVKTLLILYRNYDIVADKCSITRGAIKSRNNKYWKIGVTKDKWRHCWTDWIITAHKNGRKVKEIAKNIGVSENCIRILISRSKTKK